MFRFPEGGRSGSNLVFRPGPAEPFCFDPAPRSTAPEPPVVEVMLSRPLRLGGDGNALVGVRGELLDVGVIGLTVRVSEDATEDTGVVRWWETTMARRMLTLPWHSVFSVATNDRGER